MNSTSLRKVFEKPYKAALIRKQPLHIEYLNVYSPSQ